LHGGHQSKPIKMKLESLNLEDNVHLMCPENMERAGYAEVEALHYTRHQLGAGCWGPPRLDHITSFCHELHDMLSSGRTVAVWSSQHPGATACCLVLVGAYLVLQRNMTAAQAIQALPKSDCGHFPKPWSKLSQRRTSSVTVNNRLRGLEVATKWAWFNYQDFNVKQFVETLQLWDASLAVRMKIVDYSSKHIELSIWAIADPVTTVAEPNFLPGVPDDGFTPDYDFDRPFVGFVSDGFKGYLGSSLKSMKKFSTETDILQPGSPKLGNTKPRVQNTWLSYVRMKRWSNKALQGTCFNALLDKNKTAKTLPEFASWLKFIQCRLLVRLNDQREPNLPPCGSYGSYFEQWGITCLSLVFPDGTCPSTAVVEEILAAIESVKRELCADGTSGSIVMHCSAGLGRTMTLLGACATAFDFIDGGSWVGWSRMCRPGSIQTYVQEEYCQSLTRRSRYCCLPAR